MVVARFVKMMLGIVPFIVVFGAYILATEPFHNYVSVYVYVFVLLFLSTRYLCMYVYLYNSVDTYVRV
jgi:hypothetical protein